MWGRVSVPTRLVNRGGPGSPLQLLDCALLNMGSASHVHAHTRPQVCTGAHHMLAYQVHGCTQPHARATHLVHVYTHTYMHTCMCAHLHAYTMQFMCMHMLSGACVHTCAHIHAHIDTGLCVHTQACTQRGMPPCAHPHVYTRMHTRTRSAPSIWGLGTVDRDSCPSRLLSGTVARRTRSSHTWTPSLLAQVPAPLPFDGPSGGLSHRVVLSGGALEGGLHSSERGLGRASRDPGVLEWGAGSEGRVVVGCGPWSLLGAGPEDGWALHTGCGGLRCLGPR